MSKSITAKEAKAIREKRIAHYEAQPCFEKAVKGVNCGAYGRIFELMNANDKSKKTKVAKECSSDNYIYIRNEHGEIKSEPLESKTNGGRIDKALKELAQGKDNYIVYKLRVCNSTTNYEHIEYAPIVCHVSTFINALLEMGAIATKYDKNDADEIIEYHQVVPSNRKLWKWVKEYPTKWAVNEIYDWFDFIEE